MCAFGKKYNKIEKNNDHNILIWREKPLMVRKYVRTAEK